MEQTASFSSHRPPRPVFVSYHGQIVKKNIISFLRLVSSEVNWFINTDDVTKGSSISETNSEYMTSANIYVIILSPEYFKSVDHLNDLVTMYNFARKQGRSILLVYFNLTRSELLSDLRYLEERQKRSDHIRKQRFLGFYFGWKGEQWPEDHPYALAVEEARQGNIGIVEALGYLLDRNGLEWDSEVDGGEKMTEFFNILKQILKLQGNPSNSQGQQTSDMAHIDSRGNVPIARVRLGDADTTITLEPAAFQGYDSSTSDGRHMANQWEIMPSLY